MFEVRYGFRYGFLQLPGSHHVTAKRAWREDNNVGKVTLALALSVTGYREPLTAGTFPGVLVASCLSAI